MKETKNTKRYWMRMDGRAPERILHYKFLTDEDVFKRKDNNLWVPIFREWYKPDGIPMNEKEIRESRLKELLGTKNG